MLQTPFQAQGGITHYQIGSWRGKNGEEMKKAGQ